ncbi:MAG: IS5/IS1182 family transposase, partial [Candidatus Bathyarchaeota archaeon]|nr:IS5/IS1182 family transposase [Candidatus Termitimicrobium sp.]MCL2477549.1 IS5/IS1182 family transposase [Candidatus Termitimicrobium sp.]MCL2686698.1 IS5/IS1182 family transposase [Candidatus Termitimicrobium sp.]
VFKILANKYRNRRKRFEIRAALICGLINHENQN